MVDLHVEHTNPCAGHGKVHRKLAGELSFSVCSQTPISEST